MWSWYPSVPQPGTHSARTSSTFTSPYLPPPPIIIQYGALAPTCCSHLVIIFGHKLRNRLQTLKIDYITYMYTTITCSSNTFALPETGIYVTESQSKKRTASLVSTDGKLTSKVCISSNRQPPRKTESYNCEV